MKKFALIIATALSFAISGCSGNSAELSAIPETQTPSVQAAAQNTQGFTVGSAMGQRPVYVFFDAQCPHCAKLWEAIRPLHAQVRFVWIPVGLLNKASVTQGAALLKAADPVSAMNEHEASLLAKRGGITASSDVPEELELAIAKNSKVMRSFGAQSVPFIVAQDTQGATFTLAGVPDMKAFAARIGAKLAPN